MRWLTVCFPTSAGTEECPMLFGGVGEGGVNGECVAVADLRVIDLQLAGVVGVRGRGEVTVVARLDRVPENVVHDPPLLVQFHFF